ncbi:alpha/beta hydrolase fold domain-containing protein [Nocardia sp. NPDC051833]|uniref:alpha/beta hydrolase fold domain-containing protein n=1 Tax=Nocardia sp. NPDC051833 TaxID=3155674 RepID=UPI003435F873
MVDLLGRLARETGATIYVPTYRFAPEHPYPAAVDDAEAVWSAVSTSTGRRPEQLILAGDSAGGGAALCTAIRLREAGRELPAGPALICPWLDLSLSGASVLANADVEPLLTLPALRAWSAHYRDGLDPCDPLVSPLYADLTGLPPMVVQSAAQDLLADDSARLAKFAAAAGIDV